MELNELYELAGKKNVKVTAFSLPNNTAVTIKLGDCCFVGVNPEVFFSKRKEKVVIAHELGHIETDSLYAVNGDSVDRIKKEAKAEKWTVETLIPLEKLKAAIKEGCEEVGALAEHFEVTEEFMLKALLYYRNKQ